MNKKVEMVLGVCGKLDSSLALCINVSSKMNYDIFRPLWFVVAESLTTRVAERNSLAVKLYLMFFLHHQSLGLVFDPRRSSKRNRMQQVL